MEMYVVLTDYEWYLKQKGKGYDEVNFWKPRTTSFKAFKPNDCVLIDCIKANLREAKNDSRKL